MHRLWKLLKRKCAATKFNNGLKNMKNYAMYKNAKKEVKKVASDAKSKAYDDLYTKLGTREGEKDIFKLARMREKKSRDLDHIGFIKSKKKKKRF